MASYKSNNEWTEPPILSHYWRSLREDDYRLSDWRLTSFRTSHSHIFHSILTVGSNDVSKNVIT